MCKTGLSWPTARGAFSAQRKSFLTERGSCGLCTCVTHGPSGSIFMTDAETQRLLGASDAATSHMVDRMTSPGSRGQRPASLSDGQRPQPASAVDAHGPRTSYRRDGRRQPNAWRARRLTLFPRQEDDVMASRGKHISEKILKSSRRSPSSPWVSNNGGGLRRQARIVRPERAGAVRATATAAVAAQAHRKDYA